MPIDVLHRRGERFEVDSSRKWGMKGGRRFRFHVRIVSIGILNVFSNYISLLCWGPLESVSMIFYSSDPSLYHNWQICLWLTELLLNTHTIMRARRLILSLICLWIHYWSVNYPKDNNNTLDAVNTCEQLFNYRVDLLKCKSGGESEKLLSPLSFLLQSL